MMKKFFIWFVVAVAILAVIGLVVYSSFDLMKTNIVNKAYDETVGTPGTVQHLEEGEIFQALGSAEVEGCYFAFLQKPGTLQIKVYLTVPGNTVETGKNYRVERNFQTLLPKIGTCEENKILALYKGLIPEVKASPGASTNNVSQ